MGDVTFRSAQTADLPAIVRLLADDDLGAKRETVADPVSACYREAFDEILASDYNQILVGEMDGEIVAFLQLFFIPHLSLQGSRRAQLESVRVASNYRGRGIGKRLIQVAIQRARQRECKILQFTTNKSRTRAAKFYERLGFESTSLGFKMKLEK